MNQEKAGNILGTTIVYIFITSYKYSKKKENSATWSRMIHLGNLTTMKDLHFQ